MFRWIVLALVLIGLCSDAEGKRRRPKHGSHEIDTMIEELRTEVAALEARIDGMSAGTGTATADATCPSEKVHLHFDDEDAEEDHSSPDDTHIHINLNLRSKFDHIDFDDDHTPEEHSAHCELQDLSSSGVEGHLHFTQMDNVPFASVHVDISNFPDANQQHAMHVHQSGDLSEGFSSLGGHYDPCDDDHDVADLGVLSTDSDRVVDQMIDATKMSLFGRYSIIGRSVIVHDKDGAPMAACVIGRAKDNPEHDHPIAQFLHHTRDTCGAQGHDAHSMHGNGHGHKTHE